ncbi:MAG: hypothetical protein M1812_002790 [Candelaria pacifica]|nr:MAG: hypothetical protein M1812_002790 [Candelaria pacifica]
MRPLMVRIGLTVAASFALISIPVKAQTFSTCNPLTSGSCPPDSALGKAVNIDLTSASDSFTAQGNVKYDSNGASFTVSKAGDSPQLTSKWYIMFGKMEVTMKAAPGAGIVSSATLQSDDLDEIDWEWLGADPDEVQSNYFGKGQTTTYNRGAFHADPGSQTAFKKYTIDWTADQVVWQIDGNTVRALKSADAQGQYPQTPMQVKLGAWSGGDSANQPGTIEWARGPTVYSNGPFTMVVKSVAVTDYSTGTQYTYSGTDGTWQSIKSNGGKINSSGSGAVVAANAPAVTSVSNNVPAFEGTHRDTSSTFTTPDTYPWVANPTTLQTSTSAATSYPGLPSGWTVSDTGKVIPPSSAAPTAQATSSSSPDVSAAGGSEVITKYNDQGFPVVVTQAVGASSAAKSYDNKGFLITNAPATPTSSSPQVLAAGQSSGTASGTMPTPTPIGVAAGKLSAQKALGAACGFVCAALVL